MPNDKRLTVSPPTDAGELQPIVDLVLDSLGSEHSRRAYQQALIGNPKSDRKSLAPAFIPWYLAEGKPGLNKAIVQRYKTVLQTSGLSPSTINRQMSAVRKLAAEAADNGLIEQALANGISRVHGVKSAGRRAGNWLSKEQAQQLIDAPDVATRKGLRDRALLAVMIGAGLRRSEAAALTLAHVALRDGRWVIVDLVGKGNRVRSVPIPSWAKAALDAWCMSANIQAGRIFRPVNRNDQVDGEGLTPQAVFDIVGQYSAQLGLGVSAHDLRRSFAKLSYAGGSGLDQIQLSLGHASIQTTERYLGVEQDLVDAPADRLGLRLKGHK